jgi:hypothetical protein
MNEIELKAAREVGSKRRLLAELRAKLARFIAEPLVGGRQAIEAFRQTLGSAARHLPAITAEDCLAEAAEKASQIEYQISELEAFVATHPLSAEQEAEASRPAVSAAAQRQTHRAAGY